jgi:hypothetical protein
MINIFYIFAMEISIGGINLELIKSNKNFWSGHYSISNF